jgi:hypothetical protein
MSSSISSSMGSSMGSSSAAANRRRQLLRYYIVDARSKMAMQGNKLMGKGVEQVKHYRDGTYAAELHYMNIANIHAARESIDTLQQLCRPGALENASSSVSWHGKVDSTGWLGHVLHILKASNFIVEAVSQRCGVLVHCSDGWDRTSQLSSLAQMCLDPYYRTLKGFHVLIEKEWLAYGHKFSDRCSHNKQEPSEERSPVFTLFMDCVWQIMRQYPSIFEFNEVSQSVRPSVSQSAHPFGSQSVRQSVRCRCDGLLD